MKYVLAGLAIAAAVAALFFRPPQSYFGGHAVVPLGPPTPDSLGSAEPAYRAHQRANRTARGPAFGHAVVYVAGEVVKPGLYALRPDQRAQDALVLAGGPKPDADLIAVNLAAHVSDGEEIAIPKIGADMSPQRRSAPSRVPGSHGRRSHRRGRAGSADTAAQNVDLNSADEAELETLPGIGPGLAARIVAYREANGPFASVDELADISGISPALQDRLADYVVVR